MAGETNLRLVKLEHESSTIVERADNLRRDLERVKDDSKSVSSLLQDLDKRLALVGRDVESLQRKLDELLSRRWQLWKLVLAALLGSLVTIATGFWARAFDRALGQDRGAEALEVSDGNDPRVDPIETPSPD